MSVIVIEDWMGQHIEPRWGDLQVGDGLLYEDGSLFIVESRAVDDWKDVTYITKCVVPPEDSGHKFGSEGLLSKPSNERLPKHITIVKSTR